MPYVLPHIEFVGGETQDLIFHCYYPRTMEPFDLSRCTANFAVIDYNHKEMDPLISREMTITNDIPRDGDVMNVLKVTLPSSDTVDLFSKYIYQISIVDRDGTAEIPKQGIIHIINNINKAYLTR